MPASLESFAASRLNVGAAPHRVDRANKMLRGMVVAMRGEFKTPGRGFFDGDSLAAIVYLGNKWSQGLKSRFQHPTACDDGLGAFVGRVRNFYLSVATRFDGEKVPAVRADLHFDRTAFQEPPRGGGRPLALYTMDLAESDPDALSSSLVIDARKEIQLNPDGTRKKNDKGEDVPPRWAPRRLFAADLCDTGDAVDGILSGGMLVGGDPLSALTSLLGAPHSTTFGNETAATASALLDRLFSGRDRDDVSARIDQFKWAYLARRFGG